MAPFQGISVFIPKALKLNFIQQRGIVRKVQVLQPSEDLFTPLYGIPDSV